MEQLTLQKSNEVLRKVKVDITTLLDEMGLELAKTRGRYSPTSMRIVLEITTKGGTQELEQKQLTTLNLHKGKKFLHAAKIYEVTGTRKARGQGRFWVLANNSNNKPYRFPPEYFQTGGSCTMM